MSILTKSEVKRREHFTSDLAQPAEPHPWNKHLCKIEILGLLLRILCFWGMFANQVASRISLKERNFKACQRQAGPDTVWTRDTDDGHEIRRAFLNEIFGLKIIFGHVFVACISAFGSNFPVYSDGEGFWNILLLRAVSSAGYQWYHYTTASNISMWNLDAKCNAKFHACENWNKELTGCENYPNAKFDTKFGVVKFGAKISKLVFQRL